MCDVHRWRLALAVAQVLLGDCSPEAVTEQAAGVVEAVLQGRNSVVMAMGQAGSNKTHTLLGADPGDLEASSSTGNTRLPAQLSCYHAVCVMLCILEPGSGSCFSICDMQGSAAYWRS